MRRRPLLAAGVLLALVATSFGLTSHGLHLASSRVHRAVPQGASHGETLYANHAALAVEAEAQFRIQPLAKSERDRTLGVANITLPGLPWVAILLLAPRRPRLASRIAEAPARSPPVAPIRVISVF